MAHRMLVGVYLTAQRLWFSQQSIDRLAHHPSGYLNEPFPRFCDDNRNESLQTKQIRKYRKEISEICISEA